ncbi:MULE domain-containing protein [Aphis craccivora]|uniref:MULE domain-containing protein n=1 Tax=Aphis craccivora TaxID=307492 RepID=A0A6G0W0S7_APHCR|nr:MULE domain-containing protein [Aphis craccivora]
MVKFLNKQIKSSMFDDCELLQKYQHVIEYLYCITMTEQFMSQREKCLKIISNFKFRKINRVKSSGEVKWRCTVKTCRAFLKTVGDDDRITEQSLNHKHESMTTEHLQVSDVRNIKRNIYNARRKILPPFPKSIEEIQLILDERALALSKWLYMDGTFSYCPKYFTQMFTIHVTIRSLHVTFLHLIKTRAQFTCVILCLPVSWAQFTIAGLFINLLISI